MFREKFFELSKKLKASEFTVLVAPSPNQIRLEHGLRIEWSDYDTAEFYRNWLESKLNIKGYKEHQLAEFPLFDARRPKNCRVSLTHETGKEKA